MRKYEKVGDYLRYEFIEKYGVNQLILSKMLKVHPNRINEIVRGKRGVTIDTDLRLCRFFKLGEGHFFDMQNELEYKRTKDSIREELGEIIPYDVFFK